MKWVLCVLVVVACLWIPGAYKRAAHPFRLSKCEVAWPFVPEWETGEEDPVFSKPFTYLNKGKQSYVFLSHDGQYVLKLLRVNKSKAHFGQWCVEELRKLRGLGDREYFKRHYRIARAFNSYYLAFSRASECTGVEKLHLNLTEGKCFIVKDKLGRSHRIDPSRHRYILQRRADPFIATLLVTEDAEARHLLIDSFFELLQKLQSLSLLNLDPKLSHNFGILDGRVMLIDAGDLHYEPECSLVGFENNFKAWLRAHFPEDAIWLEQR